MNLVQPLIFMTMALVASVAGAICGIGGGVIIKPVLDLFGSASVSTISFLSGCTVLSMSAYSVIKLVVTKENQNLSSITPMAIGAALGGVIGKELFTFVKSLFRNQNTVGAVQALCLALITIGTLLYTLNKNKIKTHNIQNQFLRTLTGTLLGVMSSFLGIGGGPINLVVLYYLFSMDTKTASASSLYIILFSQSASLISSLMGRNIPEFNSLCLILMVAGGIAGGIIGRNIVKKIDDKAVDKLFIILMIIIIFISIYNACKYSILI